MNNQTSCAKLPLIIYSIRYNAQKLYFTILFTLYLAIASFGTLFSNTIIYLSPLILGVFALLLLSVRIKRKYIPIYVYIGLLVTFLLISSLIVGRTNYRIYLPFLFIVSNAGIALLLIRGYAYSWGGYIVFYALAVYFLILIITGVDTSVMGGRRNAFSLAMLIACIPLYITLSREKKKIDLKPAVITLLVSIWGVGRSGILSSFVLLFGLLLIRFRVKKIIIGIIIFLIIAFLFQDVLFEFIMSKPFFRNPAKYHLKNMEYSLKIMNRYIYWSSYFNNLDLFRLIFGVNVFEYAAPEVAANSFNYHNSFIHLHLQSGLMGAVTMAIIGFTFFQFYRSNKVFFVLLLSFSLRASTDWFIFFSRADFIIFFFLFYFLKNLSFRIPHAQPLSTADGNNSSSH